MVTCPIKHPFNIYKHPSSPQFQYSTTKTTTLPLKLLTSWHNFKPPHPPPHSQLRREFQDLSEKSGTDQGRKVLQLCQAIMAMSTQHQVYNEVHAPETAAEEERNIDIIINIAEQAMKELNKLRETRQGGDGSKWCMGRFPPSGSQ